MSIRRRLAAVAAFTGLSLTAAACGSSATSSSAAGSMTQDQLTGSLTVFAAASLTEAFNDAKSTLQSAHPGLSLTFSFAGSQQLVTQIQNGAPADVVATADNTTMQRLVTAGVVDAPVTFARNKLAIAVAPGNPKHVNGLADLSRSDIKVVLADPSVPAGKYGRQALQAIGIKVTPVSLPLDVKSELLQVEEGNADAAIVYVTDVSSAGSAVTGVAIPDNQNVVATYPIAVVKGSKAHAAAQALVAQVVSGAGQQAVVKRGFLGP